MTVFKGYLRIIKRNIATIGMYAGIFIIICLVIQSAVKDSPMESGFESVKIGAAVVDRDGGTLAGALRQYLEREQNLVEIEDDPQVIQEELYYRNIYYVLVIPQGVEEALKKGKIAVQAVKVPDSYSGYYLDACVNSFLNQVRICLAGGFSMEEACATVLETGLQKAEVNLVDLNGNSGVRASYNYYFAYLPYALISCMIMSMSMVIMEFQKKEVRQRMNCSAVSLFRQNLASFGAFFLLGVGVWSVFLAVQALLYGGGIFRDSNRFFYIENSLACVIVSMSLSYLTGLLAKGPESLNGLNNVVSMSLCFLGGIFVPVEMLGSGIRKVARFLPTYWYSQINGILGDYGELSEELLETIYRGLLIQVLFAAACLGVALVVSQILCGKLRGMN